jgi:hypothetical protein
VDSIKAYYAEINRYMDFNVPTIIAYSDSLGTREYFDSSNTSKKIRYNQHKRFRVGERIRMSIEIDASYDPSSYSVRWIWFYKDWPIISTTTELEIEFTEEWIGELVPIKVQVISNETWHRYLNHDDELGINFTVLPPMK